MTNPEWHQVLEDARRRLGRNAEARVLKLWIDEPNLPPPKPDPKPLLFTFNDKRWLTKVFISPD